MGARDERPGHPDRPHRRSRAIGHRSVSRRADRRRALRRRDAGRLDRRAHAQALHGGRGPAPGLAPRGDAGSARRRLRNRRHAGAVDQAGHDDGCGVFRARHARPAVRRGQHAAEAGDCGGGAGGHGRGAGVGARQRRDGAGGGRRRGAPDRTRVSNPVRRRRRVRRVRGVPLARPGARRVPGAAAHDGPCRGPGTRPGARVGLGAGSPDRRSRAAARARDAPRAGRRLQRRHRCGRRGRDRRARPRVQEPGRGPEGEGRARRVRGRGDDGARRRQPADARRGRRCAPARHAVRESVRGQGRARGGWDGRGVPGLRPRAAGAGRDQDAPARGARRRRGRARALQAGNPPRPEDCAPKRRAHVRPGRGGRHVLPHHGVRGRHVTQGPDREPRAPAGRGDAHRRQAAVPGARGGARAGHHPSRHQAAEHGRGADRVPEGDGLRHRPARDRAPGEGADAGRDDDRHARLHVAGTDLRYGARRAERPLLGGRGAVRVPHRAAAVRGRVDVRADGETSRGAAARPEDDQRGSAAVAGSGDIEGHGETTRRQVSNCRGDARCACGDARSSGRAPAPPRGAPPCTGASALCRGRCGSRSPRPGRGT